MQRSLNKKIEFDKVLPTVETYLQEAEQCGNNGLYLAGCIMYGAALEAMLLAFVLANLDEVDTPTIKKACEEGDLFSLVDILGKNELFSTSSRVEAVTPHIIREIRNFIHSSRLAYRHKPISKEDFFEVKEIFHKTKDHVFYWLTGDCDIEEEVNE